MSSQPGQLVTRSVSDLHLDRRNPRLPEELEGRSESEVLVWMYEHEVLEELAQSFVDNGYFQHEPLVVVNEESVDVVVEGNRRLAALMILLHLPMALEAEVEFDLPDELTESRREDLSTLPCWLASSRDEVRRFLGFRHIGGIKTWKADAKARYLTDEIARAVDDGSQDPFREVGRRVGSNALGVRNPFLALLILRAARDDFGIDSRWVQRERFGVWTRCMNAQELKNYIGLGDPRTYPEVTEAVQHLDEERLREVIADLTATHDKKALVADSRYVTIYAAVLANNEARAVLRKHDDLDLAAQVVADASLPTRIQSIADRLDILVNDVHRASDVQELVSPTDDVYARASTLRAAVKAKLQDAGD